MAKSTGEGMGRVPEDFPVIGDERDYKSKFHSGVYELIAYFKLLDKYQALRTSISTNPMLLFPTWHLLHQLYINVYPLAKEEEDERIEAYFNKLQDKIRIFLDNYSEYNSDISVTSIPYLRIIAEFDKLMKIIAQLRFKSGSSYMVEQPGDALDKLLSTIDLSTSEIEAIKEPLKKGEIKNERKNTHKRTHKTKTSETKILQD